MRHLCRFVLCHVLLAAALCLLVPRASFALSESDQDKAIAALQASVKSLQASVSALQTQNAGLQSTVSSQAVTIHNQQSILLFFTKKTDPTRADGKKGTELFITGANLHIVNGLGATNGEPSTPYDAQTPVTNGLGNIIIGYNASRGSSGGGPASDIRTGSHNLVVGDYHDFSSFGGLLSGAFNRATAPYASLIGGRANQVTGNSASVIGGSLNKASGSGAVVLSGHYNRAIGENSSVTGGDFNTSRGMGSSVTGGYYNTANGFYSGISGGSFVLLDADYGWAAGGTYPSTAPGPGVFHSP